MYMWATSLGGLHTQNGARQIAIKSLPLTCYTPHFQFLSPPSFLPLKKGKVDDEEKAGERENGSARRKRSRLRSDIDSRLEEMHLPTALRFWGKAVGVWEKISPKLAPFLARATADTVRRKKRVGGGGREHEW